MENRHAKKLFYGGEANFKGNFIVKIYLSDKFVNGFDEAALVLCKNNLDQLNKIDLKKFKFIIISLEIAGTFNDLKYKNINNLIFKSKENISFFKEGDLIELSADGSLGRIFILYRMESSDNVIVPTNRCNNKCIMCPQPIYINESGTIDISRIEKIFSLIDRQTNFLTITGGEPTLLKESLIKILKICKNYLPNAKILLLTNGRMLSYISFVDAINSVGLKFLELGIPIHSYYGKGHDSITQVPDSFAQTIKAIKNLIASKNNIEIRVVIQKNNYLDLTKIADFIIKEIPDVNRVSFIGMEALGWALKNIKDVWIPYQEIKDHLEKAVLKLLTHKVNVNIYNIPPCKVGEILRPLCAKSISDYKVRFLPECNLCKEKENCGGIFYSSLRFIKEEGVIPIK